MKAIGKRILIVLIIVMLVMGGTAGGILAEEKETSSSTEPTVSQDLQQADSQSSVTASSTAASEETVVPTTKVDLNQATDASVTGQKTEESPAKTESVNGANIVYSTHVQNVGWQDAVSNGDISGTTGMSYRLEGIRIAINGADMGVTYRTHVQDYGWQSYVNDNEVSGTVGQAKRLEAIQIDLTGNQASQFDVYYRVHAQDYGWLDWAKNGQMAGTEGLSKRLEAIQIQLVAKGGSAPGATTRPYVNQDNAFMVKYQTHVQDIGWQNYVGDGNTSGTQGQSKRLEAIQIKLGSEVSGGIQYRTHIQNVGWENSWASDGNMSGTQGRSLRLEAIQIELTGDAANQYDVYYRVHAQNFGWMGWAKNGESAGTEGYAYRLEAIQIQLVSKGGAAPGSTDNAFSKLDRSAIMAAYQNVINENKYTYDDFNKKNSSNLYLIFDMDSNQIPELIIIKGIWSSDFTDYYYTYKNGQAVCIGQYANTRAYEYYGQSSGTSGTLISIKARQWKITGAKRLYIANGSLQIQDIMNNYQQYGISTPNYPAPYYPTPYRVKMYKTTDSLGLK